MIDKKQTDAHNNSIIDIEKISVPLENLEQNEPHNVLDNLNNSNEHIKMVHTDNEEKEDNDYGSDSDSDCENDDFWEQFGDEFDFKYEKIDPDLLRAQFKKTVEELRNINK